MGIWIFLIGFLMIIGVGLWAFAEIFTMLPLEIRLLFVAIGIMIAGGILIEFEKWKDKNKND